MAKAKAGPVEKELRTATGISSKEDETRKDFLKRLVVTAENLTDEDYGALSDAAQVWLNKATVASNKKRPIEDFDDGEQTETETVEAETEEAEEASAEEADEGEAPTDAEESETKVSTKAKKTTAAKPVKAKTPAKANGAEKTEKVAKVAKAPAESRAGKKPGKSTKLKQLILKNVSKPAMDLQEAMQKAGHEISMPTLTTIRSDFMHSLRVLQDAGALKEDVLPARE